MYQLELFSNNEENYGLKREDLGVFRSTHIERTLDALEDIFYGMHNIQLPRLVLSQMNTADILALYVAVGYHKRYDKHRSSDGIRFDSAEDLISKLVDYGYQNYSGIRIYSRDKKGFTGFPKVKHSLRRRINALPESIKQGIIRSFEIPYWASHREQPEDATAFHDPIFDDERPEQPEDIKERNRKSRLIRAICDKMAEIYRINAQQKT